jgi:hypothetical protein
VDYYLEGLARTWAEEVYLTVSSILGPTGISGMVYKLVLEKLKNVT